MSENYTKIGWKDEPSKETPINAYNLNHMDEGIERAVDEAVASVKNITTGSKNGTISVDGNNVPVKGLKESAFQELSYFEKAGSASDIIGKDGDTPEKNTIFGLRKYIFDLVEGVKNLLNGHTIKSDVPENAKFTDTVYNDTEIKKTINKYKGRLIISDNKNVEYLARIATENGKPFLIYEENK